MNTITKRKQEISAVFLGLFSAVIVWVTILRREETVVKPMSFQIFHSFQSIGEQILNNGVFGNFLGNVILFSPIGFLLPMVTKWKSWRRILITGMIFSLTIETIQLITSKGFFEFDDIILNTTGTMLGYSILCFVKKLLKNRLECHRQTNL